MEPFPPIGPRQLVVGGNWPCIVCMATRFPVSVEEIRIAAPLHGTEDEDPVPNVGLRVQLHPGHYAARLTANTLGCDLAPSVCKTLLGLASRSLGLCADDIGKLILACGDAGLSGIFLEAANSGFGNAGLLGCLADRPDSRGTQRLIERVVVWTEQGSEGHGTISLAGLRPGPTRAITTALTDLRLRRLQIASDFSAGRAMWASSPTCWLHLLRSPASVCVSKSRREAWRRA